MDCKEQLGAINKLMDIMGAPKKSSVVWRVAEMKIQFERLKETTLALNKNQNVLNNKIDTFNKQLAKYADLALLCEACYSVLQRVKPIKEIDVGTAGDLQAVKQLLAERLRDYSGEKNGAKKQEAKKKSDSVDFPSNPFEKNGGDGAPQIV